MTSGCFFTKLPQCQTIMFTGKSWWIIIGRLFHRSRLFFVVFSLWGNKTRSGYKSKAKRCCAKSWTMTSRSFCLWKSDDNLRNQISSTGSMRNREHWAMPGWSNESWTVWNMWSNMVKFIFISISPNHLVHFHTWRLSQGTVLWHRTHFITRA